MERKAKSRGQGEQEDENSNEEMTAAPTFDPDMILDGPKSIEHLRQVNEWVARNSAAPTGQTLAMPPAAPVLS